MNQVKVFPIRLSADFHQELKKLAEQSGKSLHQYVIEVLEVQVKNNGNNYN